eukprot:6178299-Pleurochrysis_carterae.AAC.2
MQSGVPPCHCGFALLSAHNPSCLAPVHCVRCFMRYLVHAFGDCMFGFAAHGRSEPSMHVPLA